MKKALFFLFISCLFIPIIGQGNKGDMPQQQEKINCNEDKNRQNPQCLKDESNQILDEMKTNMPGFINEMKNQTETFSKLSPNEQNTFLKEEINNFGALKEKFNDVGESENSDKQNNRKEMVEKASNIAEYLTQKDCSSLTTDSKNSGSGTMNEDFKECRNEKKDILNEIINYVSEELECDKIINLIEGGMSDNKEDNFKYILFLIYELTSNSDSLDKGKSEVLYNITLCLQENFENHWQSVEDEIKDGESKDSLENIKQDVSLLLIKTLTNLINILHYDEIDGYINKNISDRGLMRSDQGKKIQKGILDFAKQFNDFGSGEYNVSNSMNIFITVFNDADSLEENKEKIYNLSDKGIYVKLKPKEILKGKEGEATLQFVSFESPLVSVETNDSNNIVRDFISITLFDQDKKEINITNLPDDSRPIIFYNLTQHKNLNNCYFYNDESEDLDTSGIESENNYDFEGEKFLKCSSKHLTSFTAGYASSPTTSTQSTTTTNTKTSTTETSTEKSNSSSFSLFGIKWWQILILAFIC